MVDRPDWFVGFSWLLAGMSARASLCVPPVDQGYFPIRGNTVFCNLHFIIVTIDGHCSKWLIMALELFVRLFCLFDSLRPINNLSVTCIKGRVFLG